MTFFLLDLANHSTWLALAIGIAYVVHAVERLEKSPSPETRAHYVYYGYRYLSPTVFMIALVGIMMIDVGQKSTNIVLIAVGYALQLLGVKISIAFGCASACISLYARLIFGMPLISRT